MPAGRPRKQIDPRKVEAMASVGSPASEIAAVLGCNEKTIERNFGTVLKNGHQKCCHTVRSELFKQVRAGNVAATIFLAKALLGLRENPDTVFNISASATGGIIQVSEESRKQLVDLASEIRARAFQRSQLNRDLMPSANGDVNRN